MACSKACSRHASRDLKSLAAFRRSLSENLLAECLSLSGWERLHWVYALLRRARDGDRHLADVLTFPDAFSAEAMRTACPILHRAGPARFTADPSRLNARLGLPQIADLYCRENLRCRVWEWVSGTAGEPDVLLEDWPNAPERFADTIPV